MAFLHQEQWPSYPCRLGSLSPPLQQKTVKRIFSVCSNFVLMQDWSILRCAEIHRGLFHGPELMIEGDLQFTCWNFSVFYFRVNQHTHEKCENLYYAKFSCYTIHSHKPLAATLVWPQSTGLLALLLFSLHGLSFSISDAFLLMQAGVSPSDTDKKYYWYIYACMCICHLETSPPGFEPNYGSSSDSFCIAACMTHPNLLETIPPFSDKFSNILHIWTVQLVLCFVITHMAVKLSECIHFYWS